MLCVKRYEFKETGSTDNQLEAVDTLINVPARLGHQRQMFTTSQIFRLEYINLSGISKSKCTEPSDMFKNP